MGPRDAPSDENCLSLKSSSYDKDGFNEERTAIQRTGDISTNPAPTEDKQRILSMVFARPFHAILNTWSNGKWKFEEESTRNDLQWHSKEVTWYKVAWLAKIMIPCFRIPSLHACTVSKDIWERLNRVIGWMGKATVKGKTVCVPSTDISCLALQKNYLNKCIDV